MDVVDLKLVRHSILHKYNDYEIVMVLRNRLDSYIPISKSMLSAGEGMFKNKYVDVLKSHPQDGLKFNLDPNKTVLEDERYEIKVGYSHGNSTHLLS